MALQMLVAAIITGWLRIDALGKILELLKGNQSNPICKGKPVL